ncbi:MAG: hemolysin family protein [Bacteroidia bacterium]
MDNPSVIIIASILFSAFFAGMEIAFISANKLLIELKNKQGSLYAKILSKFVANPSKFISTTLVGNNIGLVVYGIYMARLLNPVIVYFLPVWQNNTFILLFIQSVLSTILVLVAAEFIPKVLFRINPDNILKVFAIPFLFFYYLFWPIVSFTTWLAKFFLNRVFKIKFKESTPVFSKVDLDDYISQLEKQDLPDDVEVDTEIFKNALDFSNLKVRDCLTPRTELVSIEINQPIKDLYELFIKTGLSKILVYEENPDQIIGYVHQKEMFKNPKNIRSIVIPVIIATETTNAMDLINKFSRSHKSLALVVDELGSTAGVITVEDIMEEVFGEIEDEHDVEELIEEKISDTEFRFSARLEIDYLNSEYNFNFEEGDYNTLGGYILANHEDIPEAKEKIIINRFEFIIEQKTHTKIEVVYLRLLEPNKDG